MIAEHLSLGSNHILKMIIGREILKRS